MTILAQNDSKNKDVSRTHLTRPPVNPEDDYDYEVDSFPEFLGDDRYPAMDHQINETFYLKGGL